MLLDCSRLDWRIRDLVAKLDTDELQYNGLMGGKAVAQVAYLLPASWNWLDKSEEPMPVGTNLLHFTRMKTHPWLTLGHPLANLWMETLLRAVEQGAIDEEFVHDQVAKGYVRPSIASRLEHRIIAEQFLPRSVATPTPRFGSSAIR